VLVFQKYGNQYFLSEVLGPSTSLNVAIPRSKREQSVRREEATLRESSQILIALK
jgi:hypothetical protein